MSATDSERLWRDVTISVGRIDHSPIAARCFLSRLFGGVNTNISVPHLDPPRVGFFRYVKKHSCRSSRVVPRFAPVPGIDRRCRESKIGPTIIERIAVDMIDKPIGPFASHVQPNDPVSLIDHMVYCDCATVLAVFPPRLESPNSLIASAFRGSPRQLARVRIVGENRTNIFYG